MARHNIILIATLLALVLFIAQTTASRKEELPSCREKLQSLNLNHCEKHLMHKIQECEDKDMLRMKGINHIRRNCDDVRKEKCCDQLSEVNRNDCKCKALQQIVDNLSDRLEKREMYELEREVKNLPSRCEITPPSRCDLSFDQD